MIEWYQFILISLAAFAGGLVNAIAGGGTLITFPVMTAVGLPAVTANITNTIALCPGYFSATLVQKELIWEQKKRLLMFIPSAIIGGILGGFLLLSSGERLFRSLVPYLILLATLLLAFADPLRNSINRKLAASGASLEHAQYAIGPITLAAIYGGYFGAGMSIIVLAVLGFLINDSLTRLNALKQAVSFSVNISAAIFFLFSDLIEWRAAIVMIIFTIFGGAIGGKLATKIKPAILRWVVIAIGLIVALYYFLQ